MSVALNNYSGVALSSILGKIIDLILLERFCTKLSTSQLEFGFKTGHSTPMCTMILKENVTCYSANESTVLCMMFNSV
jgi:hypothetical protein